MIPGQGLHQRFPQISAIYGVVSRWYDRPRWNGVQKVASSNLVAPTCKAFRSNELRKAFLITRKQGRTFVLRPCYGRENFRRPARERAGSGLATGNLAGPPETPARHPRHKKSPRRASGRAGATGFLGHGDGQRLRTTVTSSASSRFQCTPQTLKGWGSNGER